MKIQSFMGMSQEVRETQITNCLPATHTHHFKYRLPDIIISIGKREKRHTHLETSCLQLSKPQKHNYQPLCCGLSVGPSDTLSRCLLQTNSTQTLRELFSSKGELWALFLSAIATFLILYKPENVLKLGQLEPWQ